MIEHIVLFRFKPETKPEVLTAILKELRALKSLVPSVADLSAGQNFCDRSQGFEYGLVVRFFDRQGLDAYQVHPEHQRVVREWIRPNLEQIIAVDYEIAGPTTP
jgi:hypothetical protein